MGHKHDPTPVEIMTAFEREWGELEGIFMQERDLSKLPEREPEWVREALGTLLFNYRVRMYEITAAHTQK